MLQLPNEKVPLHADEKDILRVGSTRVSLASVIARYDQGLGAEEIVKSFPTLDLADVHQVIAYFLRHEDEVRAELEDEERRAKKLQVEIEAEIPGVGQHLPRTRKR